MCRKPSFRIRAVRVFTVFLILLTGLSFISDAAAETRLALVIGNSDYRDEPLANPVNDARLMADTLSSLGFTVYRHADLDQRGMKRAVVEFGDALEAAGPDAVSLIYYAGHGVQIQGRNYLVPVGADIDRERDVPIEAVAADEIMESLGYSESRLNIVIFDACRNNPFARSFRSSNRGLARMDAPSGTILAYSTAPGSIASDGNGRYSPYTSALVRAMNKPNLSIEEVFKRTRIEVMERTSGAQTPWESSSLTGEFSFISHGAPAAGGGEPQNPDVVFWTSIADKEDPTLFKSYLQAFPDGLFRVIAEQRIAALSGAVPNAAQPRRQKRGPLKFVSDTVPLKVIRGESNCREIGFRAPELDGFKGRGRWTHPDATGTVEYSIVDDIIEVRMRGSQIRKSDATVQIQGNDLLVRMKISHVQGSCNVAFSLTGALAQD